MKVKRIINASFWAAVAIALCIAVVIVWAKTCAPVKSIVLGCTFYLLLSVGLCTVIDQHIQGK